LEGELENEVRALEHMKGEGSKSFEEEDIKELEANVVWLKERLERVEKLPTTVEEAIKPL